MLLVLLNRVLRVLEGGPSERQRLLGAVRDARVGVKGYRMYVVVRASLQPVFHYLGLLRARGHVGLSDLTFGYTPCTVVCVLKVGGLRRRLLYLRWLCSLRSRGSFHTPWPPASYMAEDR